MKRFATILGALAILAIGVISTSAKAETNIGPVLGYVNTAAAASVAAFPPAGAAIMTVTAAGTLLTCGIGHELNHDVVCGHPAPITTLGYNQLRGLAPRPDGTTHADY